MNAKGIVLNETDKTIESKAKRAGLDLAGGISPGSVLPFEKNLIVEAGTRVPWDLLPAAWHFLERWDAAVPLWRYGVTAADVGSAAEREATAAVVRDLRVLLHSVELLFVRRNDAGCALVERWQHEMSDSGDKRLAFLRALYRVKPRLCVLPTTWLAEVQQRSRQTIRRDAQVPARLMQNDGTMKPLVLVELEPGRSVKCHAGDEERVREHFKRMKGPRAKWGR